MSGDDPSAMDRLKSAAATVAVGATLPFSTPQGIPPSYMQPIDVHDVSNTQLCEAPPGIEQQLIPGESDAHRAGRELADNVSEFADEVHQQSQENQRESAASETAVNVPWPDTVDVGEFDLGGEGLGDPSMEGAIDGAELGGPPLGVF